MAMITVDQIVSGASNVLAAVLAARILSISEFGVFTIVFLVYVTVQGIARSMVGSLILVHPKEAEERPADAISSAVFVGAVLGGVVAASGVLVNILGFDGGPSLIVLGICTPLMGLQDVGRYLGFAIQRPAFSLMLDTAWLIFMVPALAFIIVANHHTLTWFMIAWAGSGAVSGLIVMARYARAGFAPPMPWLRETWPYAWRYLASFVTNQGATLAASLGVTAIAGSAVVGALRGAQLLQRPIGSLQTAGMASGISEVSRIQPPERPPIARQTWRVTGVLTAAGIANLVALAFLPDAVGRAVLGDSWHAAKALLLPLNVQVILLCMTSGFQAALLGLKFVRVTLRIDIITIAMLVIPPVVGTAIGGIEVGCWALTGGQLVALVIWWVTYLRADVTRPPLERRSRGRHSRA
jgi:O-antigen/teichoic acid export membrane protein